MTMPMYTVKAFLEKNNKVDGEIRRFQLPKPSQASDKPSCFLELENKLVDIFPCLKVGQFSLFWKDPDGDMVRFSTDKEHMEALKCDWDSVFKVYVKETAITAGVKRFRSICDQSSDELDDEVVCDKYNHEIRDTCMECPEYDQCAMCGGPKPHNHHSMLKINKPAQNPFTMDYRPFHHGSHGHHGRHGHHRPGEPFAPPPHFCRWVKKFMKRWHHKNSSGCRYDDKDDSPDELPGNVNPGKVFQEDMGDSEAETLNPYDIDVYLDAKHVGKRMCRRSRLRGRDSCAMRGKIWGSDIRSTSPKRKMQGHKSPTGSMENPFLLDMAGDASMGTKYDEKTISLMEEEIASRTENIVITDRDADGTMERAPYQPVEPRKVDAQYDRKDVADYRWTPPDMAYSHSIYPVGTEIVAPPTINIPTIAQTPHCHMSLGLNERYGEVTKRYEQISETMYPASSPDIAESLAEMKKMGFQNDGGWLTRLLEYKNGDIEEVLNTIRPKPQTVVLI